MNDFAKNLISRIKTRICRKSMAKIRGILGEIGENRGISGEIGGKRGKSYEQRTTCALVPKVLGMNHEPNYAKRNQFFPPPPDS
jgi:hypothetical protein